MKLSRLVPLVTLLLALLLAACAPAAGGSGAPVRAGTDPIPAERGGTIVVRIDSSLDAFGLATRDLTPSLWIPSGFASETGDVGTSFGLVDVDVADGWEVDLRGVKVERRTTTDVSFGTSSTTYELWAEVRVRVPEDAIPGVYRVRGTLQARGGGTQPVAFRVDVAP